MTYVSRATTCVSNCDDKLFSLSLQTSNYQQKNGAFALENKVALQME